MGRVGISGQGCILRARGHAKSLVNGRLNRRNGKKKKTHERGCWTMGAQGRICGPITTILSRSLKKSPLGPFLLKRARYRFCPSFTFHFCSCKLVLNKEAGKKKKRISPIREETKNIKAHHLFLQKRTRIIFKISRNFQNSAAMTACLQNPRSEQE